jgi:hypothetical protein
VVQSYVKDPKVQKNRWWIITAVGMFTIMSTLGCVDRQHCLAGDVKRLTRPDEPSRMGRVDLFDRDLCACCC